MGKFASFLGPLLPISGRAKKNLKKAFPDYAEEKINKILKGVFNNLGRLFGEFPHLAKLTGESFFKRVEVDGRENIEIIKNTKKPVIVFSGHFANWEILPKTAHELGYPLSLVYRRANNKFVDKMIMRARKNTYKEIFDKGRGAARGVYKAAMKGGHIGMLVDQKMNDGISLKFFGREAMTAPALADFAIKFDAVILPAVVVRKNGAHFKVKIFPQLEIKKTGKLEEDRKKIMQGVNDILEGWVRENPEQWFWLHNRWKNFNDL